MSRPQHPMLALRGAHEREAHEGRLIELEATHALALEERLKPLLALRPRERAPIEPLEGNLDALEHLLHGLRDAFPAKTAAQSRMALGEALPGAKELRFLQWLVQPRDDLLDVSVGIASAQTVEQHPRLRRGQFVRIDYRSHGACPERRISATPWPFRPRTRACARKYEACPSCSDRACRDGSGPVRCSPFRSSAAPRCSWTSRRYSTAGARTTRCGPRAVARRFRIRTAQGERRACRPCKRRCGRRSSGCARVCRAGDTSACRRPAFRRPGIRAAAARGRWPLRCRPDRQDAR